MVTIQRPLYTGSGWRCLDGNDVPMWYSEEVDSLEQAIYDLVADIRAVAGGPGSTLTGLLEAIAAIVTTVDGLVTLINGKVDDLNDAIGTVLPPTYPGLIDRIEDLRSATAHELPATTYNLGNIYDALTAPLNVGTLPNPPPEGYGGGASASDVWAYEANFPTGNSPGIVQSMLNWMKFYLPGIATLTGHAGYPDPRNGDFLYHHTEPDLMMLRFSLNTGVGSLPVPPDTVDWSLWNGTDDLLTFLNAQESVYTWTDDGPDGEDHPGRAYARLDAYWGQWYECRWEERDLPWLSARGFAAGASDGPPVWPGIAGVDLGEPVAFDDVAVITGPMHGILVDYTTPPQKTDKWEVGTFANYGHAGQLAFVNDEGYAEAWQYLQWDKQVYVPRALSEAASVLLRPIAGQEGTVTPWTLL